MGLQFAAALGRWVTLGAAMALLVGCASRMATQEQTEVIEFSHKDVASAIFSADAAARKHMYGYALQEARKADAIRDKTPVEKHFVHRLIVAYAIQSNNLPSAKRMIDLMLNDHEADRSATLEDCISVALRQNDNTSLNHCAAELNNR